MNRKLAEAGDLIFIKSKEKARPYLCIKTYTNNAGIIYNWLVLPITSKFIIGHDNLYPIEHEKLNKRSYVKLNNIQTISWHNSYEVKKNKIKKQTLDNIISKICNMLK